MSSETLVEASPPEPEPDALRPELQRVLDRKHALTDEARPEAVARQHAAGKLTARERLDLLLDPEDRVELGGLVTPDGPLEEADAPADGVVLMTGLVGGRPVVATAWDFTVLGGSYGNAAMAKAVRAGRLALQRGIPHVNLLDSGGHRIHSMDNRHFALGGEIFEVAGLLSGWVPQVAAVMGPAFAGPPMFASTTDFVPMVKGTASLGLAGPSLVKRAIGKDVALSDLDSRLHLKTGVVDAEAADDVQCLGWVRQFLSYLPTNASEPAPRGPVDDPADRLVPELRDVVPEDRRQAYDVRKAVGPVLDHGELFELQRGWAKNLVVGLGRLGGRTVGVLANQPKVCAGALDRDACIKATRFLSLCDAFGIPLVSFIDSPGVMPGLHAEELGVSRYLGKLVMAWSQVTVPHVAVTLRKGYGAGYVSMGGGRSFDSTAGFIWPTAEICAMGIEGAVDVAFRKQYAGAPDPEARRLELIESFYQQVTPERAASGFGVDDVIDPADTRRLIGSVLRVHEGRRQRWEPPRRHHVEPM